MLDVEATMKALESQTTTKYSTYSGALSGTKDRLQTAMLTLEEAVLPEAKDRVGSLSRALADFSVKVSLVGQIKAGKTALTNALIGMPEMLPSDVNPWTSVVTSVNINTPKPPNKNAVFRFYTSEEWHDMLSKGGRLGELAQRANFEAEADEMREQIQQLQERTKKRLGRNFNMLLNSQHSFLGFNPDLISRYVCLGEEGEEAEKEGKYADVTKSADLFIDDPSYHMPITICDTPGVNDPFLLREAVTVDTLGESDLCVIVLSAHQAFSKVDIGLIRVLLSMRHEQIILFINRIDELENPHEQIKEIDGFVREVLEEQGLPGTIPIVFGSALWGAAAMGNASDHLTSEDFEVLKQFEEARAAEGGPDPNAEPGTTGYSTRKTGDLSGVFELKQLIQDKAAQNVGRDYLDQVRKQSIDLARQSEVLLEKTFQTTSPLRPDLDIDAVNDAIERVLLDSHDKTEEMTEVTSEKLLFAMSAIYRNFIRAETVNLNEVLDRGGDVQQWNPDTEKLRRDLNDAYEEYSIEARNEAQQVLDRVADNVGQIYDHILMDGTDVFSVVAPDASPPKTPVSLMKTMTIDLSTNWLRAWFAKNFNRSSYIKRFSEVAREQMRTTIKEMLDIYVAGFAEDVRTASNVLLTDHIETIQNLSQLGADAQREELRQKLGLKDDYEERMAQLQDVQAELSALFNPSRSDTGYKDEHVAHSI